MVVMSRDYLLTQSTVLQHVLTACVATHCMASGQLCHSPDAREMPHGRSPLVLCCHGRAAKKAVEEVAKEQVIAARISGVPPSMHVILSPNTDGDEATITTADIIAGRSYLHKVDAVLVPTSMLKFLEDFTAKKANKTAKAKKGNVTVAEALKAKNATANATRKSSAKSGDMGSKAVYLTNATNETKNSTAAHKSAKSAGSAADVVFTVLVGLPVVLAAFLVL